MSRRARALALLGPGIGLVALGPVLHWAVLPAVRVAPWDPDSTTVSTGEGRYLDPTTGQPGSGLVTVTEHIQGDAALGRRMHAAVWTVTTRVDTPTTVDATDARQALQLSVHRWVFDRVSNAYRPCCDADTGLGADAFRKFPFHADAPAYRIWDPAAGAAFASPLSGTRVLHGNRYNAYTTVVPRMRVGTVRVPPGVVGVLSKDAEITVEEWYRNPETVTLVEPVTGTPVSVTTHEIVTLQLPGDPRHSATALDVTLRTTPDTEKALVDRAAGQAAGLDLLSGPVPWLLSALGAVLVGLGARLLRGRTEASAPADPAAGVLERAA